jgi:N-acetylglucosamine-6-phosphate deacetylase
MTGCSNPLCTKKDKPFMRKFIVIPFISILLLLPGFTVKTGNSDYVEGLSYIDLTPVRVEFADGRITRVIKISKLKETGEKIYVAPGLFDNQVNGYKGVSFVDMGGELTLKGVELITRSLWEKGVTSYMPTLTTNDKRIFIKNFALLAKAKEDPVLLGSIPGFHLEGPYISPVDGYRGAHPLKFVRKPDWNEFMEMYEASGKNILEVTLAPEAEGAPEFISKCVDRKIVVALGHHNGSMKQVTEAIDRGARIATHFGNGCANTINRHQNPLWPQLSDDRLMLSIIGDGFHLLPEEIKVFYKVKGPDKIIITSDVSPLGGLAPGRYLNVVGDTLELTPDGAVIYPAQKVLSGSGSALSKGVGNVMKVTGCTMEQVFRMASKNPAKLYGLNDRGELKPGMRADIILFTMEDFKMNIRRTIVAGHTVYDSK